MLQLPQQLLNFHLKFALLAVTCVSLVPDQCSTLNTRLCQSDSAYHLSFLALWRNCPRLSLSSFLPTPKNAPVSDLSRHSFRCCNLLPGSVQVTRWDVLRGCHFKVKAIHAAIRVLQGFPKMYIGNFDSIFYKNESLTVPAGEETHITHAS